MITLNGKIVEIGSFPDGTILMKQHKTHTPTAYIEWRYENDREFLALIYLVKHLRRLKYSTIDLYMPYIPNARQDRVKSTEDVFTLKYFAEVLNSLNFNTVTVLDPHSTVSEALINNLYVIAPRTHIDEAIKRMQKFEGVDTDHMIVFYPDAGAAKRYTDLVERKYAYAIKKRDWETGKIIGLEVIDNGLDLKDKDVFIIDDICSRGGTFYYSAMKLKELGVRDIYLYVSHCENTVLEGDLLKGDLIKKLYTTDSIFTKEHKKIEVL
jgi:ribose-phosphate pyrophosphokinase